MLSLYFVFNPSLTILPDYSQIFDEPHDLAGIGTVNFDNRSFNINFEITLWFTGENMIRQTEQMLIQDLEGARQTDRLELQNRRYAFRVLAQAAKLFSPIL